MKTCCQQSQLYAAEEGVPTGRSLKPQELQGYVDDLRESAYWQRNFPEVLRIEAEIRTSSKDGSVGAWFEELGCGAIEMAPCHLTELAVLHEVAHVCAHARYGSRGTHDPWFARTYLELVSAELDIDIYYALYHAFVAGGIDFDHESSSPGGRQI